MAQHDDLRALSHILDLTTYHDGVKHGRLKQLQREETRISDDISGSFYAYTSLSRAVMCLYVETMDLASASISKKGEGWYLGFICMLSGEFLYIRAAETAALAGYTMPGFSLLRNVFDRLVLLSACLQEPADFKKMMGISHDDKFDRNQGKKIRIEYEKEVRKRMTGMDSGLSDQVREFLSKVNKIYDEETHPAMYSRALRLCRMPEDGLSVSPEFDLIAFEMFMNRHYEVLWMAHRLLPSVQLDELFLPDEWKSKWTLIDAACERMVGALRNQDGVNVGAFIGKFIKEKFPFDIDSRFPA